VRGGECGLAVVERVCPGTVDWLMVGAVWAAPWVARDHADGQCISRAGL